LRPTFRTTGTIAIVPTQPLLDNHRGSTACGTTRAMKSPTYTQIACELRLRYVQLLQICRRAPLRCSHAPEVTLTHVR